MLQQGQRSHKFLILKMCLSPGKHPELEREQRDLHIPSLQEVSSLLSSLRCTLYSNAVPESKHLKEILIHITWNRNKIRLVYFSEPIYASTLKSYKYLILNSLIKIQLLYTSIFFSPHLFTYLSRAIPRLLNRYNPTGKWHHGKGRVFSQYPWDSCQ